MSSMDTRIMISDDVLECLPYVEWKEEEEEEGDEEDVGKKKRHKGKGLRSCTVEDMKECLRMAARELNSFLDQVVDRRYVVSFHACATDTMRSAVSFTPTVCKFCI